MYKLNTLYLSISALIWVIFLSITVYFSRFSADDFFFLSEIRTKSWISIFNYLQYDWHTRFSSNFLLTFLLQWSEMPYFLVVYFFIALSLLFAGIFRFLKYIFLMNGISLTDYKVTLYSINAMGILFFCTFSVNDVWFWFTSSTGYLVSSIAFIFGISCFLKTNLSKIDYGIILIASLFISGSIEPTIIISLLFAVFYFFRTQNKEKKVMLFLSISILIIGFLIIYFGSGTSKREAITPSLGLVKSILFAGYGTMETLIYAFPTHFLPAFFLATPFLILGKKINKQIITKIDVVNDLLIVTLFITIVLFINCLVIVIPLGDFPPKRALEVTSLILFITIIHYFIKWGSLLPSNEIYVKIALSCNLIGLFIFVGIVTKTHQNYAMRYDERMLLLKTTLKLENNSTPIYLEKLPSSGYLPSAEITTDSTHFLNKNLKLVVNSTKVIILKEDK